MSNHDPFETTLSNMQEFETFVHQLFDKLPMGELHHGESLIPYVERHQIRIPEFLQATDVTWHAGTDLKEEGDVRQVLVLIRPGQSEVLGFRIGCITIGHWRICLECGFWYCRVVISRRFLSAQS